MTTPGRPARRLLAASAAILAVGVLPSCSTADDSSTGTKGYITGEGSVTTVEQSDRQDAPAVAGETLAGATFDAADHLGQVVVLNVWGSWCPPCRAEADDIKAAVDEMDDVVVMGINIRDREADAEAFVRDEDLNYDSIHDEDGSLMLAFYGMLRPDSVPSTIVLDEKGRIAALVLGSVTTSTLVGLVDDVQKGS